jgi:hypothetical protein
VSVCVCGKRERERERERERIERERNKRQRGMRESESKVKVKVRVRVTKVLKLCPPILCYFLRISEIVIFAAFLRFWHDAGRSPRLPRPRLAILSGKKLHFKPIQKSFV